MIVITVGSATENVTYASLVVGLGITCTELVRIRSSFTPETACFSPVRLTVYVPVLFVEVTSVFNVKTAV